MNKNVDFHLSIDEIKIANSIHEEITVKYGLRQGLLYRSSKNNWRQYKDKRMATVYYIWRTLAFRMGQDIRLPLQAERLMNYEYLVLPIERIKAIINYIGEKFFEISYRKYIQSARNECKY